jgi:hypothetical protein
MTDVRDKAMKRLQKGLVVSAVVAGLLALPPVAAAAPAPRVAEVTLTSTWVGNTLRLTATTPKHGSGYANHWAGVNNQHTFRDTGSEYVSTTDFSPPGPGTYVLAYGITMQAGNSGESWTGSASVTVIVGEGHVVSVAN